MTAEPRGGFPNIYQSELGLTFHESGQGTPKPMEQDTTDTRCQELDLSHLSTFSSDNS